MRKKIFRILLLLFCVALLAWSLLFEQQLICTFDGDSTVSGGDDFVLQIERRVLMRGGLADGAPELFDARSLIPQAAQVDDCPT